MADICFFAIHILECIEGWQGCWCRQYYYWRLL